MRDVPAGVVAARALVKAKGKVWWWDGFYAPSTGEFAYIGPGEVRCLLRRDQYIDVEVLG